LDKETKKLMLNLLFKNIKIAHKKIFSFSLFVPFNFLFSEQENFYKCQQNQELSPKKSLQSILGLSAGRWLRYRRTMERIAQALVGQD